MPSFIVLDQPSQAFLPRDRKQGSDLSELSDTDRDDTKKLYKMMMYDVVESLEGELQIIAFDQADFTEDDWFQESIIETWRDGRTLVPLSWIEWNAGN